MNADRSNLARRNNSAGSSTSTMSKLLITLFSLVITALVLLLILYFMRQRRRAQKVYEEALPVYSEKRASSSSTHSHHRRNTARPIQITDVFRSEKETLIKAPQSPSTSDALPEIRVTFPEEVDESGKRQSGKVVVVRVGDTSVGLEPLSDDTPPAYQQIEGGRLQSIDLERVGGLVEQPHHGLN